MISRALDPNKYRELYRLFKRAENRMKDVERLRNEAIIPSLNELRYVAYHCINSIVAAGEKESDSEIALAEKHSRLAIYDSMEAGISYLLLKLKNFKQDYKAITIGDIVPDYLKKMKRANEIRDLIKNTDSQNRENYYVKSLKSYKELSDIIDELEMATEELNKKLKTMRIQFWGIGVVGIVIGIIGIIVMIVTLCKK